MEQGGSNPKILLVGNPNVGKSVIFGWLTGAYAMVSNYPGTTVAVSRGTATIRNVTYDVVDTPGINSLLPMSEDECVTRDCLLEGRAIVIQVADAKNLQRALPVTLQLQEMKCSMMLVVNMCDEAAKAGIKIDARKLERDLGIPVITTVAVKKLGLDQIKTLIGEASIPRYPFKYSENFQQAVDTIEVLLPDGMTGRRAVAVMLLSGDRRLSRRLSASLSAGARETIEDIVRQAAAQYAEPVSFLMSRERMAALQGLFSGAVEQKGKGRPLWAWLSHYTMHPFWGFVFLAGILWVVYKFVGEFGAGTAVDFIENGIFAKYISPGAIHLADRLLPFTHTHLVEEGRVIGEYALGTASGGTAGGPLLFRLIHDAFVGPYGLVTMGLSYGFAIVLPIVTTFFIAFSVMEDSGYLPRLAVMVNRAFKWMGLNGKAVLPMVLGLGCDTMATLTTRILETRKQRMIVILLLALAVPCSAQLGVILGMFGQMPIWTFWVWLGVLLGIMFFVGFVSNKIIKGEGNAFVMEIPPLRLPQFGNVAKKVMSRMEWYVKEAIPLFLLGTLILFLLDAVHALGHIQRFASPLVVHVLGLPKEAANAFLIGFLRRDYGATGFFDMFSRGQLDAVQALIALVVITLFIPCVANLFMMIKEQGLKTAVKMTVFIVPFSFFVGGILRWVLK